MDMRERDTHNAIKGECLEEGRNTELVSKQVVRQSSASEREERICM
jgi:hypothetical protein